MCASSRIFFVPLPSKRACTTLPIFAGVSSMRYAPSLVSTSSTLPPSAERRAAISLAARSRPSRSRLPVSIETSSFSVSRSGWRSFFASASTGSTGCAAAKPGRAAAKKAAVQRRRTRRLTVPPSGGCGKTEFYPGRGGGVRGVPDIMRQVHPLNEAVTSPHRLSRGLMILLAVSVFAGAGTIHYQTPMLGAFAVEFNADAAAAGWVATLTFGGFLAGTIFLVPLGDRFDKRRVVLAQLAVLIPALLAMAAAPSLAALAAAGLVVGATACFAQIVIPLAAEVAPPEKRGRVMGAILACLFLGILFGRMAGGLVASTLGWRLTYVGAAAMLLALAPALVLWLPSTPSRTQLGYGRLLRSLAGYLRGNATLRRPSTIQFLLGISYGRFWATVALMLAMFHGFGPAQPGLTGLPGAA